MKQKRPIGVLLIVAYYAIVFGSVLAGIAYTLLSSNPAIEFGQAYYRDLSGAALTWQIFSSVLGLSAAIAIFLMRKIAVVLFLAVFVVGLINTAGQIFDWGWFGEAAKLISQTGVLLSLGAGVVIQAPFLHSCAYESPYASVLLHCQA